MLSDLELLRQIAEQNAALNKSIRDLTENLVSEGPVTNGVAMTSDGMSSPIPRRDELDQIISEAVGAGSVCWENLSGAGVFQSERAGGVVDSAVKAVRDAGYVKQEHVDVQIKPTVVEVTHGGKNIGTFKWTGRKWTLSRLSGTGTGFTADQLEEVVRTMLVTKGQSGPFQLHSTIDIPQAHPINFENEDDEDEEEIKPF